MTTNGRVFAGRLAGVRVFDPIGDQVGRVRDVVVSFAAGPKRPVVQGLVIELAGRRRLFVPMVRVTSLSAGQVITTGLLNMRRFELRAGEALVMADLLDRRVQVHTPEEDFDGVVEDVAMSQTARRDWVLSKVFCRRASATTSFGRRRGPTELVDIAAVSGLHEQSEAQTAERLLESLTGLRIEDLAGEIHDLSPKRRLEVAAAMTDERLADVLEELPEDDQLEIIHALDLDRAADILEEMEPDDAADLLSELPADHAQRLLLLMEPDEAAPLRRLLTYAENTAGGMMTPEPVILPPDATVAEALAVVRDEALPPALAANVFVSRPPLEAPTGRFLGVAHIQRLLREPPHEPIGSVIDKSLVPLHPDTPLAEVTREFAAYNVVSLPVTDKEGRLLGAVTVDDVLDHLLPDDWRDTRREGNHG